ncbi:hypothetical protein PGTUg99_017428 [Puccinia graminis f. sp. tritici]|uniref:Uncharacterized protein n=1 Tax=Puccinia graminis f. sp. tritici TaxID=56615 RepID=A0A5B0SI50_PUCGR|nr:hypothetical protein PGTUg99_017428 [Puccinia graminis f. sp. tritici]
MTTRGQQAPYGEIDPDRLSPPQGEAGWGCDEFKKKLSSQILRCSPRRTTLV